MKRLLLGAALAAAWSASANAQTLADYEYEFEKTSETFEAHMDKTGEIVLWSQLDIRNSPDIVVTATRVGTAKTEELTAPVSVITQDDIQARNNSYVTDLLRSLPGISVNSSGPAGNLTQIRVRGSEANHVLVLIDGVEASNPNTGEFDFAGLRAEDVLRIEMLRGEQSALYGSDAVGGVINIITRAGSTTEGITFSLEGGSRNTLDGQVSAVVPVRGASLSINGNAFTTDGYDISGLGGEEDGSKSRALNIGLNNVELGRVTLSGKFGISKLKAEFDADSNFNGRLENTPDELTTDTLTARTDARFELIGFDHLITLSTSETETVSPNASFQNDTTGDRTTLNWAAKKEWDNHSVTVLAETEKESFSNFGGAGAGQNQSESIRDDAVAADYSFNKDAITLTASARQDFNDRFKDEFTWRVGGGYKIDATNTRVRASIGTGVKNPTLTELFGFFPAFFVGNPNVTPERSLGYNIGLEQSAFDDTLNISIDYFHSDLENEIFTDFGVFPSTVRNRATDSTREGVEVEARWKPVDTLSLRGSATFLDAEENGVKEIRRPDFLASMTATWQPVEKLSLTASVDYTGDQIDTDFATFAPVTLDAYTLVGANIAYDVNDIITLTLRGDNLAGEDYQEVVGYASQGRGIYAGLRARF